MFLLTWRPIALDVALVLEIWTQSHGWHTILIRLKTKESLKEESAATALVDLIIQDSKEVTQSLLYSRRTQDPGKQSLRNPMSGRRFQGIWRRWELTDYVYGTWKGCWWRETQDWIINGNGINYSLRTCTYERHITYMCLCFLIVILMGTWVLDQAGFSRGTEPIGWIYIYLERVFIGVSYRLWSS